MDSQIETWNQELVFQRTMTTERVPNVCRMGVKSEVPYYFDICFAGKKTIEEHRNFIYFFF